MGNASAEAGGGREPRVPVALDELLRAHRRELLVHCYRMLGSWTDAEDCVQEASLRAWKGLSRFEGRASMRSWLHRIATNACLTALRTRARKSLPELSTPAAPAGAAPGPVVEPARWIQPFPTTSDDDAETLASSRESLSLAFVVALQCLPPRQRAALLLRDVVGYGASEVADILKTTRDAVNSALIRARGRMDRFRQRHGAEPRLAPLSAAQRDTLESYVKAWETGDVEALVSLFSRDAIATMPPFLNWYRGRAAIVRWLADHVLAGGRRYRLFPTVANGRPAFAFYKAGGPCLPGERADDTLQPHCIQVVWLGARRVRRVTSFLDPLLVSRFGVGPQPPAQSLED